MIAGAGADKVKDFTMVPLTKATANTWEFLNQPVVAPSGFREYDARWRYPQDINLIGVELVGLGIGTQMRRRGLPPLICVANDYREYSLAVKQALILGLVRAGIVVKDIGVAVSPMAYFAQAHLGTAAVAMVTASHNPNGWTGIKIGFEHPLTHGPDEMAELKDIVLQGEGQDHAGGRVERVAGVKEAYLEDLCRGVRIKRRIKAVCATGNGTASAFAPELLQRLGVEVVPLHTTLDYAFPNYNPNPEALEMLHDMTKAVAESGADLALGFDGDGDRCGVVDGGGEEIFADKIGLMLARDYAAGHRGAHFVVDVKSTSLFATDPVLRAHDCTTEYWKTGHSHMKRRVKETGALAGFEKSGHYFLAGDIGRGFDCGLRVAVEVCRMLDRHPDQSLADIHAGLPKSYSSPTMSLHCPDDQKYQVSQRITAKLQALQKVGAPFAGRQIADIVTVNGCRVQLADGGWALVRPSSNTPTLVVVCESQKSVDDLKAVFAALDAVIRTEPSTGAYDQTL